MIKINAKSKEAVIEIHATVESLVSLQRSLIAVLQAAQEANLPEETAEILGLLRELTVESDQIVGDKGAK